MLLTLLLRRWCPVARLRWLGLAVRRLADRPAVLRPVPLLVGDFVCFIDELEQRRAGWKPLAPRYEAGALTKYAKLVGSASEGAVTN